MQQTKNNNTIDGGAISVSGQTYHVGTITTTIQQVM